MSIGLVPGGCGESFEMITLVMLGFWRGPGHRLRWPHPRELVDPHWPAAERRRVAAYLRAGTSLGAYCGYSWCRFPDGPPDEAMGSADITDGVWVWPEGLPVYVERYAVRLPGDFLAHAAAHDYLPPIVDKRAFETAPYSDDAWVAWVRAHRRNRFLALLSRLVPRRRRRPPPEPPVYEVE